MLEPRGLAVPHAQAPHEPRALLGLVGIGEGLEQVARALGREVKVAVDVASRQREGEIGDRLEVQAQRRRVVREGIVDLEDAAGVRVAELEEGAAETVPPGGADALLVGRVVAALRRAPDAQRALAARREELQHRGHGIGAVERALGAADDFRPADAHRRQVREIEGAAARVDLHPVDEHLVHVDIAAARGDGRGAAPAPRLDHRQPGNVAQDLEHVGDLSRLDLLPIDHGDGRSGLPDRDGRLRGGHHDRIHDLRGLRLGVGGHHGGGRCLRGDHTRAQEHDDEQHETRDDPRHPILPPARCCGRLQARTRSPGSRIHLLPALPGVSPVALRVSSPFTVAGQRRLSPASLRSGQCTAVLRFTSWLGSPRKSQANGGR